MAVTKQDPSDGIGVMQKVGDGPWTIRVPADIRRLGEESYTWTATRQVVIDDAMRVAILAFGTGSKEP